jgi:hypothetical protein
MEKRDEPKVSSLGGNEKLERENQKIDRAGS